MRTVLGVETATPWTAVGISRDGEVLGESAVRAKEGHAVALPGLLERVVAEAGLTVPDVEAIAVSLGPGSFTGLRVGLGVSKGLALARGLPILQVGSLASLAVAVGRDARIAACLDARREEVYLGVFDVQDGWPEVILPPAALSCQTAAALLRGMRAIDLLLGDATARYPVLAEACSGTPLSLEDCPPSGGAVARLGTLDPVRVDPATVAPFYARPAAAEASLT